jgi:hypothetical protein
MPTTFAEWAIIIGLPLTIAQTIYVALTYHSSTVAQAAGNPPRTSRRHLLIMSIIALISWSLFAAGQFLGKPKIIFADAIINKWSYNGGVFAMDVRGDPLLEFKNDDDIVLYVKPPVSGADYMTDERGIKSKRYTIHEGTIYLVVSINREFCSIASKTPGGWAEMAVILLPKKFSPEQITSFASIEAMGGKTVAHPGWLPGYPPECNNLK